MSRSMTLAVERIADDERFAERFRTDPDRALRRYRLSDDELAAVKRGDPESLDQHGVDVVAFAEGKRHGVGRFWRRAVVVSTLAGAVVGLAAVPAAADGGRCTGIRMASFRQVRMGREVPVSLRLVRKEAVRTALLRNGLRNRASGRASLRAGLRAYGADFSARRAGFAKHICGIRGELEPFEIVD